MPANVTCVKCNNPACGAIYRTTEHLRVCGRCGPTFGPPAPYLPCPEDFVVDVMPVSPGIATIPRSMPATSELRLCPRCGNEGTSTQLFCQRCGCKFEQSPLLASSNSSRTPPLAVRVTSVAVVVVASAALLFYLISGRPVTPVSTDLESASNRRLDSPAPAAEPSQEAPLPVTSPVGSRTDNAPQPTPTRVRVADEIIGMWTGDMDGAPLRIKVLASMVGTSTIAWPTKTVSERLEARVDPDGSVSLREDNAKPGRGYFLGRLRRNGERLEMSGSYRYYSAEDARLYGNGGARSWRVSK